MVGTDNQPEAVVGANSYFRAVMEEHADIVMFIFFLGIIAGIIISVICYYIYKFIKSSKNEENTNAEKIEPKENIDIANEEAENSINEDDSKDYIDLKKFLIGSIVCIASVLSICLIIKNLNTIDFPSPSNNTFIGILNKQATADDLEIDYEVIPTGFTEAKILVVLQANEPIKNLVLKISVYDESNKLITTEELQFGKVVPGNEYTRYISLSDLSLSEIFDLQNVKTEIIKGTLDK